MSQAPKKSAAPVPESSATAHKGDAAKMAHLAQADQAAQHEEGLLDKAVEDTFPASDPVAEVPAAAASPKVIDSEDAELDDAVEMTFPASDPVAGHHITKIEPEKK